MNGFFKFLVASVLATLCASFVLSAATGMPAMYFVTVVGDAVALFGLFVYTVVVMHLLFIVPFLLWVAAVYWLA